MKIWRIAFVMLAALSIASCSSGSTVSGGEKPPSMRAAWLLIGKD